MMQSQSSTDLPTPRDRFSMRSMPFPHFPTFVSQRRLRGIAIKTTAFALTMSGLLGAPSQNQELLKMGRQPSYIAYAAQDSDPEDEVVYDELGPPEQYDSLIDPSTSAALRAPRGDEDPNYIDPGVESWDVSRPEDDLPYQTEEESNPVEISSEFLMQPSPAFSFTGAITAAGTVLPSSEVVLEVRRDREVRYGSVPFVTISLTDSPWRR